jgi:hypothetical protein
MEPVTVTEHIKVYSNYVGYAIVHKYQIHYYDCRGRLCVAILLASFVD